MTAWPNGIPHDLRQRLERVMSKRSYGAADLWGEIREWLADNDVEAPDDLRPYAPGDEPAPSSKLIR